MLLLGILGGMVYAAIPALLKIRFSANEILTSLMLVYVAQLLLDWLVRGPWRDPMGFNFPKSVTFEGWQLLPTIGTTVHIGAVFAVIAVLALAVVMGRTLKGFEIRVLGNAPRAGRFAGFSRNRMVFFCFLLSGGLAGLAGICEVASTVGQLQPTISPGYGFTAIIVAFLGRLNPIGVSAGGLLLAHQLSRRRGGAGDARHLRQDRQGVPGHPAVLHSRLRHPDPLSHPLRKPSCAPGRGGGVTHMEGLESVILTIITASTPLLLAAIGELVVERSGVLNLGVEGMMVMGAVCGFGAAFATGSPLLGVFAAHRRRHGPVAAVRLSHADAGGQPGGHRPGPDAARPRPVGTDRRGIRRPAGHQACRASIFPA